MKRSSNSFPQISKSQKYKKIIENGPVVEFLLWCDECRLTINCNVKASTENVIAQYGMVATADISKGECLFEIPRSLLLTPGTCTISKLLQEEEENLKSDSGWVPLLIALMYEYTNPQSRWKPYLTVFPDFTELDLPMFWESAERQEELRGTGVTDCVEKDLQNIKAEFNTVVLPFIKKHNTVFTDDRHKDIEFYKKMVAFVMAYSFTEPCIVAGDGSDDESIEAQKSPPMMVPMADLLNHVAQNNAHLDFGKDSLKMVAVKDIKKGEEVFNTYGELSNFQLLHMYGFAEPYPDNIYDTVEIPMKKVENYLSESDLLDESFIERWTLLKENHIVTDDAAIVLGEEGILTEEEMIEMLKVLTMDSDSLKQLKQNDGWVEDDDDVSLLKDDMKSLPQKWQDVIKCLVQNAIQEYGNNTLKKEEQNLVSTVWTTLNRRQQYSVYVRYGQIKLLTDLLKCLTDTKEVEKSS